MRLRRFGLAGLFAAALLVPSGGVYADDNVDSLYESDKPGMEEGRKLVKEGKFVQAIPVFTEIVKSDSEDADAWNLLAYSQRKLGRFEPALKNYMQALSINPDHKGAHEYLGELYLQTGKPELAARHLVKLKALCPDGCEEYEDLRKAVEAYEKKKRG
jgi:Flp pilus assembly protein TadD